jgi:hypothetical protein
MKWKKMKYRFDLFKLNINFKYMNEQQIEKLKEKYSVSFNELCKHLNNKQAWCNLQGLR